jgi:uncharacterized membrane protein
MLDIKTIKIVSLATLCFILLDVLWIGLLMNNTYKQQIGNFLRIKNGVFSPYITSSLLVWILIVIGSYLFVLPRIINTSLGIQFLWGAIYGLVVYGVYDFTNYALINAWPLSITLIDLGWGMFANGLLAIILSFLYRYFSR